MRGIVQPILFRTFTTPAWRKGILHFARTILCDRKDLAPHVEEITIDSNYDASLRFNNRLDFHREPLEGLKATVKWEGDHGSLRTNSSRPRLGDGPPVVMLWPGFKKLAVDAWILVVLLPRLPNLHVLEIRFDDGMGHELRRNFENRPDVQLSQLSLVLRRLDLWYCAQNERAGFRLRALYPLLRCCSTSVEDIRLEHCTELAFNIDLPRLKILYLLRSTIGPGHSLAKSFHHLHGLESFFYEAAHLIDGENLEPRRLVKAMVDAGIAARLRNIHVDTTKIEDMRHLEAHTTYTSLANDFPLLESLWLTATDIFAYGAADDDIYWSDEDDPVEEEAAYDGKKEHIANDGWLVELIPASVVDFGIYDAVPRPEAFNLAKEAPTRLPFLKKVSLGGIEDGSPGDEDEQSLTENFANSSIECTFRTEPEREYIGRRFSQGRH